MDGVFEEQVRQRAYEIWVDLGRAEGQAHDHWIAAERDLLTQTGKPKKARPTAAKAKPAEAKTVKATSAKGVAAKVIKVKKARAAEARGASA